jgi:hypothetical protein
MKRFAFTTFMVIIAVLVAGCTSQQSANQKDTAGSPSSNISHKTTTPVKIVVLQDITPSTNWTGTPMLTIADLDPVIEMLCLRSGELAFGLISDDSDKGFVRLMIESQPMPPVEPSKEGNPYKVAEIYGKYKQDMEEFKGRFDIWKRNTEAVKSRFKADVDRLLQEKRLVKSTDVFSGVRRADLFMSEDDAAWKNQKIKKYIVLITDGLENAGKVQECSLKSDSKLILVNSSGSMGLLADLKPLRFESIAPAVRYLTTEKEGQ